MTLEQLETEIAGLREAVSAMQNKDEARQKKWRGLRLAATFCGVLYLFGFLGCLVTRLVMSRPVPLLLDLQFTLLFVAIPTILLANVLLEPNPDLRARMEAEAALRRFRQS